jgi:hypothetical protein
MTVEAIGGGRPTGIANSRHEKQWWAPVWKGLVMDAQAKHYRRMKNAL